jgi:hypothetical protein
MELLNKAGQGTFWRPHMSSLSVLDLTFASRSIVERVRNWRIIHGIGSDHYGILFSLEYQHSIQQERRARYNTRKAEWDRFQQSLTMSLSQDVLLSNSALQTLKKQTQRAQGKSFSLGVLGEPTTSSSELCELLDTTAESLTRVIQEAASLTIPLVSISSCLKL